MLANSVPFAGEFESKVPLFNKVPLLERRVPLLDSKVPLPKRSVPLFEINVPLLKSVPVFDRKVPLFESRVPLIETNVRFPFELSVKLNPCGAKVLFEPRVRFPNVVELLIVMLPKIVPVTITVPLPEVTVLIVPVTNFEAVLRKP